MEQSVINIGYYIIEDVAKPSYVSFFCDRLISSSNCICNLHPDLCGCFWMGYKNEKKAYKQKLGLSDEEYAKMSNCVADLFHNRILGVDGRFNTLEAAFEFADTYLNKCENIHVVGLFTTDKYINILSEEFGDLEHFKRSFSQEEAASGKKIIEEYSGKTDLEKHFIGYEIIGYDMGIESPHSYLCNSLERELIGHGLMTGKWGLIQNDFKQVEEFTKFIQGKGEPVDWIPVILYEYGRNIYE